MSKYIEEDIKKFSQKHFQHYVSCDGIALHLKQSGSSFSWLPTKKDRQQFKFVPLETFKKKNTNNDGIHSSCDTVIHPSTISMEKKNQVMEPMIQNSSKIPQDKTLAKDELSHQENKNPSETSLVVDREDCCCVEAVNRRKRGIGGPPIPPPRPSSTIEPSPLRSNPSDTLTKISANSSNRDLKTQMPPPPFKKENLPNLIVTYSKVGIVHHTEDPTPPSCGGVQSSTSFDDPLTPPPSYDSAISTPDKHFSIYSMSNSTVTPSIT